MPTKSPGKQVRCRKCQKLLAQNQGSLILEIKCVRCGTLNQIFEEMADQLVVCDSDGKVLFMNEALERISGYSLNEALGKRPSELWGGLMPKKFYEKLWKTIKKDKKPIAVEMTNRRRNGEYYDVELFVSPILDAKGRIKFFVGIEIVI